MQACVLDAYSCKCVGWKVSKCIDAQLTVDALDMALATREVCPEIIHHGNSRGAICCATTGKHWSKSEHVGSGQPLSQRQVRKFCTRR